MNPAKVEKPFSETVRESLEEVCVAADIERFRVLADARVAYKKAELDAEEAWRDSLVRGMLQLAIGEPEATS